MYATKKISRSEERTYSAAESSRGRPQQTRTLDDLMERELPQGGGKKRYYN
jgi:hypothetical protein